MADFYFVLELEEDEALWQVPLELLTVRGGQVNVDHETLLTERSLDIPMQDVSETTSNLNSGTSGLCESLVGPNRIRSTSSQTASRTPLSSWASSETKRAR